MEYTEELLKKIISLGTLGYPLQKVINVLEISEQDEQSFTKDFDNEKSAVFKAYQRGLDISDFAIDSKLFELAKNGDLKALEKYENRKRSNQYHERESKKERN